MLTSACEHAGVALGAYDDQIVGWLSKWEPETVAAIAGWVTRAARPRPPETQG